MSPRSASCDWSASRARTPTVPRWLQSERRPARCSQAVIAAVGVAGDARREVLGFEIGDTELQMFWTAFLRSCKARGLGGIKLVISVAYVGLIAAIQTVFPGSS